jgi:hypothetical protein
MYSTDGSAPARIDIGSNDFAVLNHECHTAITGRLYVIALRHLL